MYWKAKITVVGFLAMKKMHLGLRPSLIRNIDTGEVFESVITAAKSCGVGYSAISQCLSGKSKTAGGCRWEYCDLINEGDNQ